MDRHPAFVVEDQHDDLKNLPGGVGPADEQTVGRVVVTEIVDGKLVSIA